MSSFLYGLGRWAVRRRVAILVTWLTVLAALGALTVARRQILPAARKPVPAFST